MLESFTLGPQFHNGLGRVQCLHERTHEPQGEVRDTKILFGSDNSEASNNARSWIDSNVNPGETWTMYLRMPETQTWMIWTSGFYSSAADSRPRSTVRQPSAVSGFRPTTSAFGQFLALGI